MPHPGLITGQHLRTHPRVIARVGTRSSTSLATTLPAIRYTTTSCPHTGVEEWSPTVQVECWANDEATAWAVAGAVVASVADLPGTRATGEVVAAEATTAFDSPDPATSRPRVIVLLSMTVYALDPVESP